MNIAGSTRGPANVENVSCAKWLYGGWVADMQANLTGSPIHCNQSFSRYPSEPN